MRGSEACDQMPPVPGAKADCLSTSNARLSLWRDRSAVMLSVSVYPADTLTG